MEQEPEVPQAEVQPAPEPPSILSALHAEVDAFWANVLANVSAHVETPIHNYLHAEKEALKARISQLF